MSIPSPYSKVRKTNRLILLLEHGVDAGTFHQVKLSAMQHKVLTKFIWELFRKPGDKFSEIECDDRHIILPRYIEDTYDESDENTKGTQK